MITRSAAQLPREPGAGHGAVPLDCLPPTQEQAPPYQGALGDSVITPATAITVNFNQASYKELPVYTPPVHNFQVTQSPTGPACAGSGGDMCG